MKTIKGFCPYCQSVQDMTAVITAHIIHKIYFVVNCEKCTRGALDIYKTTEDIWKGNVKLENCTKV